MLENYIKKYQLLNDSECLDLTDHHKNAEWERHTWAGGENNDEASHKSYDPSVLYMDAGFADVIYEKLNPFWEDYINSCYKKDGKMLRGCTLPRFNLYNIDEKMDEHIDHIQTIFTGDIRGIPILSCIALVNDEFEGGDFCFNLGGKEVSYNLKKGECIMWPSVFLFPHYVKPVTKGQRQSFITWAF